MVNSVVAFNLFLGCAVLNVRAALRWTDFLSHIWSQIQPAVAFWFVLTLDITPNALLQASTGIKKSISVKIAFV